MEPFIIILIVTVASLNPSLALAEADCAAKAVGQNIGASELEGFMAKCQSEAATVGCEAAATEKKLQGKARKSFIAECAKDTLGK